ncbi:cell division protein ZapA [Bacteroides sp. 519]|uniref:cell division protein ZapA n=1 Tax=Bacteroides sp. 519 TaxID=2302937 RepID=UPI0013D69517|nr:cell division protein ZapA [Bacteroides sp. 519]NDV56941.1 cell division protein ZapA [Bacteroides sp. 519]
MYNDKIKINLRIADQYYPLWINRSEEELARKAAKQVETMLNQYQERFPSVDTGRLSIMVAYEFARRYFGLEDRNDTSLYTEKVKELSDELENYLRRE